MSRGHLSYTLAVRVDLCLVLNARVVRARVGSISFKRCRPDRQVPASQSPVELCNRYRCNRRQTSSQLFWSYFAAHWECGENMKSYDGV